MSDAPPVFLIGGDTPTHTMLRFLLEDSGRQVIDAPTIAALLALLNRWGTGLVIVIAGMGGARHDGASTIAALHQAGYYVPTLLLTRSADHTVRRRAFALGVLDIISLPAVPRDLRARLLAALGDGHDAKALQAPKTIRAGGLTLRAEARELSDDSGWRIRLTMRETAVLRALMSEPGRLLGRQDLLDQIWGYDYTGDGNALEVYIRRLRGKMDGNAAHRPYLRTLRGHGYLFDARRAPRSTSSAEDAPHVLLIDNTPDSLVLPPLQQAGYSTAYDDGTQVVAVARRLQPRLILLNIEMGGASGVEAHRRLRADPPTVDIPTIVFATLSCLREYWQDIHANDYLAHPFHSDELLLRVERLIGRAAPAPAVLAVRALLPRP